MSERRTRTTGSRYSPYQSYTRGKRERVVEQEEHSQTHEETDHKPLDDHVEIDEYAEGPDALIEEEAVPLKDIGMHCREQDFNSNAEVINATPIITMDVPAVDIMELFNTSLTGNDLRNTLAGMGLMINRLIFENRYLVRELHSLKNSSSGGAHRFDTLVFKKVNVVSQFIYPGTSDIPAVNVNNLVDRFDQNSTRKHDTAVNTLRRFVKYLLENIIPKKFHSKFTIRERGGYDHLAELPQDITSLVKDICLESVNMYDPRTEEDKERREELSELIYKFMKFALQELRRTPRKSKVPVAREPPEARETVERIEVEEVVG